MTSTLAKLKTGDQPVIYQAFVPTFDAHASNAPYGDMRGIIRHLDHIQSLGVDALWITPPWEGDAFGYAVRYPAEWDKATLKDLVKECHKRGIRLIVDVVFNHGSDKSAWFEAASNPAHPEHKRYKDYFVWAEPVQGSKNRDEPYYINVDGQLQKLPPLFVENPETGQVEHLRDAQGHYMYAPTNFLACQPPEVGWRYVPELNQCVAHKFHPSLIDLNHHNKQMQQSLFEFLHELSDAGVDGLRLDAVAMIGHHPILTTDLSQSEDDIREFLADHPAIYIDDMLNRKAQLSSVAQEMLLEADAPINTATIAAMLKDTIRFTEWLAEQPYDDAAKSALTHAHRDVNNARKHLIAEHYSNPQCEPPAHEQGENRIYLSQEHHNDMRQPSGELFLARVRALFPKFMMLGEVLFAGMTAPHSNVLVNEKDLLDQGYHGCLSVGSLQDMAKSINHVMEYFGDGAGSNWALNNHDVQRAVTRLGLDDPNDDTVTLANARLLIEVLLSLPGSVCVYQGEEFGLPAPTNKKAIHNPANDPDNRLEFAHMAHDLSRSPPPLPNRNAHNLFLKTDPRHLRPAFDYSLQETDPKSPLNTVRYCTGLRKVDALLKQPNKVEAHYERGLFYLTRFGENDKKFVQVFNFSGVERQFEFFGKQVSLPPRQGMLQREGYSNDELAAIHQYDAAFNARFNPMPTATNSR